MMMKMTNIMMMMMMTKMKRRGVSPESALFHGLLLIVRLKKYGLRQVGNMD